MYICKALNAIELINNRICAPMGNRAVLLVLRRLPAPELPGTQNSYAIITSLEKPRQSITCIEHFRMLLVVDNVTANLVVTSVKYIVHVHSTQAHNLKCA